MIAKAASSSAPVPAAPIPTPSTTPTLTPAPAPESFLPAPRRSARLSGRPTIDYARTCVLASGGLLMPLLCYMALRRQQARIKGY